MRIKLIIIASFLFHISFAQQQLAIRQLKAGDFLFQDLGGGDLSNAIKKVTPHYHGNYFSHVGMVANYNGRLVVMESYNQFADTISIDKFMQRTSSSIYVGRLKNKYQPLAFQASEEAKKYRGVKYDEKYLPDSNAIYCAELIYYAFRNCNQQQDFFKMRPMTFKDPATNELFPGWINYYQKYFQMEVPEGEMGINPGLLINDKRLEVFTLSVK
ncbi:MAG: YiiX/YebB-like N1pC/P60 family cysteine hydrolase [Bacteroidota bacterium]